MFTEVPHIVIVGLNSLENLVPFDKVLVGRADGLTPHLTLSGQRAGVPSLGVIVQ